MNEKIKRKALLYVSFSLDFLERGTFTEYPYVSKYIYRTQDLAKVASFSDSKPQKQHYAKINGLEKLIINTGNEPFH